MLREADLHPRVAAASRRVDGFSPFRDNAFEAQFPNLAFDVLRRSRQDVGQKYAGIADDGLQPPTPFIERFAEERLAFEFQEIERVVHDG